MGRLAVLLGLAGPPLDALPAHLRPRRPTFDLAGPTFDLAGPPPTLAGLPRLAGRLLGAVSACRRENGPTHARFRTEIRLMHRETPPFELEDGHLAE